MRVAYVVITFTNGLRNEEAESFVNNHLEDVHVFLAKENVVILSWKLGPQDDLADIDEDLYYVLEQELVGNYVRFIPASP